METKFNRVAITGIGALTPIGNNVQEVDKSLREGKNGIQKIDRFDTSDFKISLAAQLKNFDVNDFIDKRESRRMDDFCKYAMVAAAEAISDSGLDFDKVNTDRVGVIIGSGIGGLTTLASQQTSLIQKGSHGVSPLFIPMIITNMASGLISIKYNIHGASYAPVTACASSTHAIGEAFRLIKHGYQDAVICGGAEACIVPIGMAGFQNMQALSTSDDINRASMPFDKNRGGFVMGEGAGILILENYEQAKARGAKIYGEVCGYGATTDGYHITSPDPEGKGAALAIKNAITEAGIDCGEVDYINAHGTGTKLNDKFETIAIKKVFGDKAKEIDVNSTKSMTGHLLGATGAVEIIAMLLQMKGGYIHPTINFTEKDEECDLKVSNKLIEKEIKIGLSNSLGFGGHNASLIVKKGEL